MDDPNLQTALGALLSIFAFMLGRITEAAKDRSKSYPEISSRLLTVWRDRGVEGQELIAVELMKLVMDNDTRIFSHIEDFWMAVIRAEDDASVKLSVLIEAMRKSSIIGRVQFMFIGFRVDKQNIIRSLIEEKVS